MKKSIILIALFLITNGIFSQVAPNKYWVQFTDKDNSPYSLTEPLEYLSQKAIDRRNAQEISIVENDLPVNPLYIDSVASTGVTILNPSKWFNSVTIYTTDPNALNIINSFSFVKSVVKCGYSDNNSDISTKPFFKNEFYSAIVEESIFKSTYSGKSYDYGYGYNQIHMIKGEVLHDQGYSGEGMTIAVLDAGFLNANNLPVFDSLWSNGQILGTRDFVEAEGNVFNSHSHGTMVLSTMGSNLSGQLVGTAPKANFWLLRSEDGGSEFLIEELNWVSAAEFADSVGADIINSSLGYTVFDDPQQNHTYQDMDGNTAPVTIGADIAASKGIIVVNSAGNSGSSSWLYIGAPADGDSVFSIGAVDDNGNYASFSSIGPTYDGRQKPNVVAQGQGTSYCDPSGQIFQGNGTSFSSPIIAGATACLWQANPDLNNVEIMQAIEISSSLFNNPNYQLGYGIPNYEIANLTIIENASKSADMVCVYPNPFNNFLNILYYSNNSNPLTLEIYDVSGKKVYFKNNIFSKNNFITIGDIGYLEKGLYMLKLSFNNQILTKKILKN
ncbi:MAG: S8 family serine peptidase [Bacteroidales bacterium]|nr:S8 family serine peptidase [Bacteroidales bacterium]